MLEAGLQELESYLPRHQNTVAPYIATTPIMDLCLAAKRRPGKRVEMQLWGQEGLYLEAMYMAAWEAEQTEGKENRYGTETAADN